MSFDEKMIAKENFKEMIEQKNVIRTPAGHGGVIHRVLRVLEKNASTLDGMAEYLKVERKTVLNAINHLRQRHNKKIIRHYNIKDQKYYYYLEN